MIKQNRWTLQSPFIFVEKDAWKNSRFFTRPFWYFLILFFCRKTINHLLVSRPTFFAYSAFSLRSKVFLLDYLLVCHQKPQMLYRGTPSSSCGEDSAEYCFQLRFCICRTRSRTSHLQECITIPMRKLRLPFMKQSGKGRICLSIRKITSVPTW